MDLETLLMLGGALAISLAVGIQHFYDRYASNGLYIRSTRVAAGLPAAIGLEIRKVMQDGGQTENPLVARFDGIQSTLATIPSQVGAEVSSALNAVLQKAVSVAPDNPRLDGLSMGQDAAVDAKLTKTLRTAVGQDLAKNLGPYGDALDVLAPSFKSWILEHPDKLDWAMSQPWVRSLMQKVQSWVAQNPTIQQAAEGAMVVAKAWWEMG